MEVSYERYGGVFGGSECLGLPIGYVSYGDGIQ